MTRVLALHGFTGGPESFAELARRSPSKTFLCPALAGHGPSPQSAADFESELARLAAWVRQRASAPLPVLGYSLGARVALGLCLRFPELFSAALLIGVNPGIEDEAERIERLAADEVWIRILETQGLGTFLAAWEKLPLFASQNALPAPLQEQQRLIRQSHSEAGLAHALRVLGTGAMPSFVPALGQLTLPVTLLVGERDSKFLGIARSMQPHMANGRVVVIPGAGHNPLLEAPELVRSELKSLISSSTSHGPLLHND